MINKIKIIWAGFSTYSPPNVRGNRRTVRSREQLSRRMHFQRTGRTWWFLQWDWDDNNSSLAQSLFDRLVQCDPCDDLILAVCFKIFIFNLPFLRSDNSASPTSKRYDSASNMGTRCAALMWDRPTTALKHATIFRFVFCGNRLPGWPGNIRKHRWVMIFIQDFDQSACLPPSLYSQWAMSRRFVWCRAAEASSIFHYYFLLPLQGHQLIF